LKLYVDGGWKEIFVDDYIPCSKNQTLFSTNFKDDIGWLVLQKAISKINGSYFSEHNDQRITEDFLKLTTALPTKTLNCANIHKLIKHLDKYAENKVKLAHLKEEYYEKYKIPKNSPFILKNYVKINEQNGIFVIKTLENELKIPEKLDLTSVNPEYFDLLKSQINIEDSHYYSLERNVFQEIFSDVSILLGTENNIQNTAKFTISCDPKEDVFQYDVNKMLFKIYEIKLY